MKKLSFIVKLSICVIVLALIVFVTIGLFTTGSKKTMMTNEDLIWQKNRLITLSVFAGILMIGIISFGVVLIVHRKKAYVMVLNEDEEIANEEFIEVDED